MNGTLLLRAASHHVTWFLGTRFTKAIPLVFVVGYPKSGTTWACQLVADYMQLPFPRYSLLPIGCPAVVHGHERVSRRYPKCLYVIRDGRDALTSLYFFKAREIAEGDSPPLKSYQRRMFPGLVNKADVRRNFAPFIEAQMRTPHAVRVNWGDHVRSFFDRRNPDAVLVRFEDLVDDGENALGRAMSELLGEEADRDRIAETIRRFSFKRQSGRKAGEESRASFLRKGQAGDWRNHFTPEAAEIFDRYCGDELIEAGYEPDRAWVSSLDRTPAHSPAPGEPTPATARSQAR